MKNAKLESIINEALENINQANTLEEIGELRNRYLGKKSELASMGSLIATLPPEEKKDFGIEMNQARTAIANAL